MACFFTEHTNGENQRDLVFNGDLVKLAKDLSNFLKVRKSKFICQRAAIMGRHSGLVLFFNEPPMGKEYDLVKNFFWEPYM